MTDDEAYEADLNEYAEAMNELLGHWRLRGCVTWDDVLADLASVGELEKFDPELLDSLKLEWEVRL